MRIANNVMAMSTHRQYTRNNDRVQESAEKLSSGQKINRAGDDAAGLAISEKMRSQIRGLTMSSKNSQDAVSMIQTAEGALQEVHSMLQRMNELAVQSATGTNERFDRTQIAKEFEQLKREINDVSAQTTFNNMKILDGSLSANGVLRSDYTSGIYKTFEPIETTVKEVGGVKGIGATSGSTYTKVGAAAGFAINIAGFGLEGNKEGKVTLTGKDASTGVAFTKEFIISNSDQWDYAELRNKYHNSSTIMNRFKAAVDAQGLTVTLASGKTLDFTTKIDGTKLVFEATERFNISQQDMQALDLQFSAAHSYGSISKQSVQNLSGDSSINAVTSKGYFDFNKELAAYGESFKIGNRLFILEDATSYSKTIQLRLEAMEAEHLAGGASNTVTRIDLTQVRTNEDLANQITQAFSEARRDLEYLAADDKTYGANTYDALKAEYDAAMEQYNLGLARFEAASNAVAAANKSLTDAQGRLNDRTGACNTAKALYEAAYTKYHTTTSDAYFIVASDNYANALAAAETAAKAYSDAQTFTGTKYNELTLASQNLTTREGELLTANNKLASAEQNLVKAEADAATYAANLTAASQAAADAAATAASNHTAYTNALNAYKEAVRALGADGVPPTGIYNTYSNTISAYKNLTDAEKAETWRQEVKDYFTFTNTVEKEAIEAENDKLSKQQAAYTAWSNATIEQKKYDDLKALAVTSDTNAKTEVTNKTNDLAKAQKDVTDATDALTLAQKAVTDATNAHADAVRLEGIAATDDTNAKKKVDDTAAKKEQARIAWVNAGTALTTASNALRDRNAELERARTALNINVPEALRKAKDEFVAAEKFLADAKTRWIGADSNSGSKAAFENSAAKADYDALFKDSALRLSEEVKATFDGTRINLEYAGNIGSKFNNNTTDPSGTSGVDSYGPIGDKYVVVDIGSTINKGSLGEVTYELNLDKLKAGDKLTWEHSRDLFVDYTVKKNDTIEDIYRALGMHNDPDVKIDGNLFTVTMEEKKVGVTRLTFTAANDPVSNTYDPMKIQVGALQGDQLAIKITSMNTKGLGLDNAEIFTQEEAGQAVTATRSAINMVSEQRALLGAMQNRMAHKIANLKVSVENLQASESRIRDVDIASEMTAYTKNNILSQAATSMLAQANSSPQNVLSLLR